jgi:predicted HTH transcriptional regulator
MHRLKAKIEQEKFLLSNLPELSIKILDVAKQRGRVSIGDMITLTGISRNTLKQHFRSLVHNGHLVMHGTAGPGVWYGLP